MAKYQWMRNESSTRKLALLWEQVWVRYISELKSSLLQICMYVSWSFSPVLRWNKSQYLYRKLSPVNYTEHWTVLEVRKNKKLEWLTKWNMQQYVSNWYCVKVCTEKPLWHKFQSRNEKWNQWGMKTIIFSVLSRSISHLRSVFSTSNFLAFALPQQARQILSKTGIGCKQKKLICKTEIW